MEQKQLYVSAGSTYSVPLTLHIDGDRIYVSFKYNKTLLKEIRNFAGAKWHGYDETNPRKVWSIKNTRRNWFQLNFLAGKNPYAKYDEPIKLDIEFERPLMLHQKETVCFGLQRRQCIIAEEMGTGKTLSAIEIMERSDAREWWWVGPKLPLMAVKTEFKRWGAKIQPTHFVTYESLHKLDGVPDGLICDEAHKLKNWTTKRTKVVADLVERMRQKHKDPYILLMTGSPQPKWPVDWWSLCEITCPGFLKEGDPKKFYERLAVITQVEGQYGKFPRLITWRDSEEKCTFCGEPQSLCFQEGHLFTPMVNEIALLPKRLEGLVIVKSKKDCMDLPEQIFRTIKVEPTKDIKKMAKLVRAGAKTSAEALTLLRELSDGFMYKTVPSGTEQQCTVCEGVGRLIIPEPHTCPKCLGTGRESVMVRVAEQIPCPKEQAVIELLEEHEDYNRIVFYAGFTGSIERLCSICGSQGWRVIRADGKTFSVLDDKSVQNPLELFQSSCPDRIAFVGHPATAGMGVTLTASPSVVFYSNDFNAVNRIQAQERINRPGAKGNNVIDIIHLDTDQFVLDNLKMKRDLQSITLEELKNVCYQS